MSSKGKDIGKIMVLDDDPIFSELISIAGKKSNLDVVCYSDASQIIGEIREGKTDLVILDYYLGKVSGSIVASLLEPVPVILVSSKGGWTKIDDHWSSNVVGYVHKKFGTRKIISTAIKKIRESGIS